LFPSGRHSLWPVKRRPYTLRPLFPAVAFQRLQARSHSAHTFLPERVFVAEASITAAEFSIVASKNCRELLIGTPESVAVYRLSLKMGKRGRSKIKRDQAKD